MESNMKTDDGITIHVYDGDFFIRVREYEYLLKMYEELEEKHAVLSEKNERK